MPPTSIGMLFSYTKTQSPAQKQPVTLEKKPTFLRLGGFQGTPQTMTAIIRAPASSCSSCGH